MGSSEDEELGQVKEEKAANCAELCQVLGMQCQPHWLSILFGRLLQSGMPTGGIVGTTSRTGQGHG